MVTVPAWVWRYGPLVRGAVLGTSVGGFLAILAWLDSGFWLTGAVVLVILLLFYGGWMARRMTRSWPSARHLSGAERETVAAAARGGRGVDDPRLASALAEYRDGMRESAEQGRLLRWVIPVVLVAAVGSAAWDAFFGSWGNLIVSAVYLALLLLEVMWWPKRRNLLLANADRSVEMSRNAI